MGVRRTRKHHSSQSGFTLIEVTIAALITTVGLLTLAQLFALAAIHNLSSKQTTMATMVASHKVEQILAIPRTGSALSTQLDPGGALGRSNAVAGYFQNYYVDTTTKQFSATPFVSGQQPSYIVTWKIETDNAPAPAVTIPGLRRITVRAEAAQAGTIGNGVTSTQQVEVAEISTIRIR
ncbi:MAG TPA: prepilin-type N-terminal cleavage/methylation domain-containing protein [Blastocatellia bacterium]|nr:prepilin-type N-terminal cleavage/methylation domain-containing protein [Blastocatellia bacterium]